MKKVLTWLICITVIFAILYIIVGNIILISSIVLIIGLGITSIWFIASKKQSYKVIGKLLLILLCVGSFILVIISLCTPSAPDSNNYRHTKEFQQDAKEFYDFYEAYEEAKSNY